MFRAEYSFRYNLTRSLTGGAANWSRNTHHSIIQEYENSNINNNKEKIKAPSRNNNVNIAYFIHKFALKCSLKQVYKSY